MIGYNLPTSIDVGGIQREIRSDFRAVLDVLAAMSDPELDDISKTSIMVQIIYPKWEEIRPEYLDEAARKACEFIDCGNSSDGKKKPRLIDWEQDAALIVPAVNHIAGKEIRSMEYLHWWTFLGYFMEIGESTISTVIHIRSKKAKGKKLEKWEQDFYRENRDIVNFKSKYSSTDKEFFDNWARKENT